ncbi:pyridoxamine 5'-phosphate oxidase family protein [Actinacidiphila glaucinigra]|uniref:pyridoxamine 5'-phosphate oxidase family protein n=1 Tax=Actinacidiphila glaucinigra TaxID=235986 RepID=UPI0036E0FDC2
MPRRPGPDRPTAGPRPRYRPDPYRGRKAPAHGGAGEARWGRTLSQGWSVLVRGRARRVEDPEAVRYLAPRMYSGPWPGDDDRILWVRIDVDAISGRRIDVP